MRIKPNKMRITPIYISALKLNGVKTFNSACELLMGKSDGRISRWTLILGDNGIGKSTLLQCIAWMKPSLPYDAQDTDNLKAAPLINDEENETLERLVSKASSGQLTAEIEGLFVANQRLGLPPAKTEQETCNTSMTIRLNDKRKLDFVGPEVVTKYENVFYKDEVIVYGYSASRVLGKQNLAEPRLLDTIPGFIHEKSELYDAEEILHALNYAKLGASKKNETKKYTKFIDDVTAMLKDVLPDFDEVKNIEILPPKVLLNDPEGGVVIKTKFGEQIPFEDLSLGYKTVISWTIDLAWRLFNKYQEASSEPLKEPAIVLIDELDLHLHPIWQREIMENLSKHFPNVQFIATAHSPLMVQAALEHNYAVVKFDDDEKLVEVINQPGGIDGWRVDQILTSELFDLASSRGAKYDNLMAERQKLMLKVRKSKQDKSRLEELNNLLAELPSGETTEDIENRKLINDLATQIREKYLNKK